MSLKSAVFVKGVTGPDETLEDGKPQVAFIGRSNVGKSSVINSLTRQNGLARTSSFPGRTREVILFLINSALYFVDLPGYGYAKGSKREQEEIQRLIYWYLFDSEYTQKKVVFIVDAFVGLTENDTKMLYSLKEHNKDIIVIANKIDKLKKSAADEQLKKIKEMIGRVMLIPYSSKKNIGAGTLMSELLR
ncbi:ribosome biogenesis GTP-binding protein YsxC [Candidatus Uhrbacteria bacterium]|nr:ribosome biogenesis GTP-binding protein YsxC [Candidatus Uhrbacteria bacterium]